MATVLLDFYSAPAASVRQCSWKNDFDDEDTMFDLSCIPLNDDTLLIPSDDELPTTGTDEDFLSDSYIFSSSSGTTSSDSGEEEIELLLGATSCSSSVSTHQEIEYLEAKLSKLHSPESPEEQNTDVDELALNSGVIGDCCLPTAGDAPKVEMKTKCKPLFPESPRSRRSRARAKAKARTRAKAKAGEIALAKSSWKTSSPAVGVPPERLDARATSQYYRDKAKKEFKNLVNANLALRRHNEALRAQWHSDLNFALTKKPAHTDVTSKASRASSMPYLPGETRKERNRRAAKKSREAAKLRVRKVKEENALLAKDNKFLAHRLTEAGIAVDIEAAGVLSDATEPLSGHRSPTLQSRPSKRRKKSFGGQLKQIGGIGCFSALMIFAAVALISSDMSCHEQPCSESPGTNTNGFGIAAKVGMSLERAMATSFDSSLSILASSLCFISLLFGVASHFRREVYKL